MVPPFARRCGLRGRWGTGALGHRDRAALRRTWTRFAHVHLALLALRNLHALVRGHPRQIVDFRPGRKHKTTPRGAKGLPTSRWLQRLGKRDQLVEYPKPAQKPDWIDQVDCDALPETLVVRELRIAIQQPGRRTTTVTLAAALLDPERYPAKALAKLYRQRGASKPICAT